MQIAPASIRIRPSDLVLSAGLLLAILAAIAFAQLYPLIVKQGIFGLRAQLFAFEAGAVGAALPVAWAYSRRGICGLLSCAVTGFAIGALACWLWMGFNMPGVFNRHGFRVFYYYSGFAGLYGAAASILFRAIVRIVRPQVIRDTPNAGRPEWTHFLVCLVVSVPLIYWANGELVFAMFLT